MVSTTPIRKNGITNVIFNLMCSMDKTDISFDLLCENIPDHEYYKKMNEIGGNIYTIDRNLKKPFSYIKNVSDLIKQNGYDIVHAHGNSSSLIFEMLAAQMAGCKVRISHSHNTTCSSKILNKLLKPFFINTCTCRLACGQDAGKWMFGNRPFTVINNGIDTKKFRFQNNYREEVREIYKIPNNALVIGHVGVFNQQKNHDYLIDIFNAYSKKRENVFLMLVGEGSLKKDIEEKVNRLGLEQKVVFVGGSNKVEKYLAAIDVIVMPSLYEGLPLSLIEAQANGLPCIISDVITKEVDKTGLIYYASINTLEEWIKQIQRCLPSLNREDISQGAVKKIIDAEYSIDGEAKKLQMLYSKALNDS